MLRKMYGFCVGLFLFAICMALAACGRSANDEYEYDGAPNAPAPPVITAGEVAPAQFLTTQTLHVAAQAMDSYIVHDAARRLEAEMNAPGVGLDVVISIYAWEDIDAHLASFQTRIAAGVGYDVFTLTPEHPLLALVMQGHLADIFPLINNCRHTAQGDYFTHVLEGLAFDGRLYTFPLAFMYMYVGVNAQLPPDFLARFAGYESVSFTQMMQFYIDLQADFPVFEPLAVMMNAPSVTVMQDLLHPYIDWRGRVMRAPGAQFVNHVQTMGEALADNLRHGIFWEAAMFTNPRGTAMTTELALRFVFDLVNTQLDPINAFLPQANPYFVHYTPLRAACGALMAHAGGTLEMLYGISNTADGALAFAFLRHMTEARHDMWRGQNSLAVPIRRDLFYEQTETALRNAMNEPHVLPFEGQGSAGAVDALVHAMMAQLSAITEEPVFIPLTRQLLPSSTFFPPFSDYMAGETDAEEAVRTMQANIAHFLLQPVSIEADATIMEEIRVQAEREEMPAVTISVLAPRQFRHVINQAAQDMNRAWAQADKPYVLVLALTDYDFDESEAVQSRVQTMLMAGQGYDVMFWDWIFPYRTFAQAGFLHDIYPLIDACPHHARGDFFQNVLSAFEVNGHLYAFPLSFGFEWASVNMALPQPYIDYFAAFDRISIGQLMMIYADLRAAHEMEFGRLQIGHQAYIGHPSVALPHVLGSFVDFNARTANFTDGRFAAFLEDFRATFAGGLGFDDWVSGRSVNVYTTEFLRDFAREFVFQFTQRHVLPAHILFDPVTPVFGYGIPVSDEYGRLRIRVGGGQWGYPNWATLMFPAAGNAELAWEFSRHLFNAFVNPLGSAATSQWGGLAGWGQNSMAIPIRQDAFEAQMRAGINYYLRYDHQPLIGVPDDIVNATDNAINRMRQYMHEPVVIPPDFGMIGPLIQEDVQAFLDGIATAAGTAQRVQDRVTLWFMEQ